MTTETTNPVDGEAMPEVVDDLDLIENDDSESFETNREDDDDDETQDAEGNEEDIDEGQQVDPDLEDVEWEGKAFKVPKGIKEAMLRYGDYTQKTQQLSREKTAVEARETALRQAEAYQQAFIKDVAVIGALDSRLEPYASVKDWPSYLRQGGVEAQAQYAEFNALMQERQRHLGALQQKVQERTAQEQKAREQAIQAGRQEMQKHIKGYGPDMLSKMEQFAQPFGFSPEEIREAEADPRSLRLLHLAMVGHRALQQQKRTSTVAKSAKAKPVTPVRGAGGRIVAKPDTDDFAAFERMADERFKPKR